jgi:transcriptional repressor NrdR
MGCKRRSTTYERVQEKVRLSVVKRDGSRVPYDRGKIRESIRQASYKRPITVERVDQAVDEVEEHLITTFEKEVSSQVIGERVANVLRKVDQVAYVRFASVYRRFEDVGEFIEEAQDVLDRRTSDIPGQQTLFGEPEG